MQPQDTILVTNPEDSTNSTRLQSQRDDVSRASVSLMEQNGVVAKEPLPPPGASFGEGPEFDGTSEALHLWMNPIDTLDFLDLSNLLPEPALTDHANPSPKSDWEASSPVTAEHSRRIRSAWPRKRATPVVRLVRNLWSHAIDHAADNLFSSAGSACIEDGNQGRTTRWNMDDDCRSRLIRDCSSMPLPAEKQDVSNISSRTSTPSALVQTQMEELSPDKPMSNFPSTELLDMSLDFYFRRFHPGMPFLHPSTFDARATPTSLLLPMCLIGLSILNPGGAKSFIRQYLRRMIRACRIDLTYKALGRCGALTLLTALASSLLVLCLALNLGEPTDEAQMHMLVIQTLFICDRHGLFQAYETEDPSAALLGDSEDTDRFWKAWARIESLKRLILSMITMDAAYTQMLDLLGHFELDKIELMLPCESALFNANTALIFFQLFEQQKLPIIMSRWNMQSLSMDILANLNRLGLRVLLDTIFLRESVARHRLLARDPDLLAYVAYAPAKVYARDSKAKGISILLTVISSNHYEELQQDDIACIMWNRSCMALTADIDRLHRAFGRDGPESAQTALFNLAMWAKTTEARRGLVHAAQIFRLFPRCNVSDNFMLMLESTMFNAALLLAAYLYVTPQSYSSSTYDQGMDSNPPPVELLQPVRWDSVGSRGLASQGPENIYPPRTTDATADTTVEKFPTLPQYNQYVSPVEPNGNTKTFIDEGGPFSFDGEIQYSGSTSARKILLNFAHLLDESAPLRDNAGFARSLRTISDVFNHTTDEIDADPM